jgi:hypothetical protein
MRDPFGKEVHRSFKNKGQTIFVQATSKTAQLHHLVCYCGIDISI